MKRLILLFLCLIPMGVVAGQSASTNYTTQRSVVVSGGSADSASYRSTNLLGQAATGTVSSGSYQLSAGFLFPLSEGVPTAVGLSSAESGSLLPFWLLVATAFALLATALHLRQRVAGKS